jgi:hypothetical protein
MAFSLGDLFRPTQQVVAAPPTPGQQGSQPLNNQPAQQQPNPMARGPKPPDGTMQVNNPAAGAGTDGGQSAGTGEGGEKSPLDSWAKVWDTPSTDKAPADPWSQPILPSDPAKIREAARGMDMLSGISPELIQKAQAGGDTQALMQLINAVAQNTLAMGAQLSAASVERAGSVIRDRTDKALPEKLKNFQLDQLPADNPVMNHPGAQGLLKMTRQQLKMTNPDWSAQRINDEAVKYLTTFAQTATQAADDRQNAGKPQARNPAEGPDWSTFLES